MQLGGGMSDDTRDKVIRLEATVDHMSQTIDSMRVQLDEVHDVLTKAKGAKWAILTMAAIGGFIAGKLGGLSALLFGR